MKFISYLIFMYTCFTVSIYAVSRIKGGSDAPDGGYPYMVSLRDVNNHHFCGGSILNKRFILTAAHCLERVNDTSAIVVAGTNFLDGRNEQVYHSLKIIPHEDYSVFDHDIGLIRVDRDIEFNEKVQPIKLPKEEFTKVNYPAVITGWGRECTDCASPNRMKQLFVKVDKTTDLHVFANAVGAGICSADSGGPLVADNIQIGIVSFGPYYCADGNPEGYANVYSYINWITNKVGKF